MGTVANDRRADRPVVTVGAGGPPLSVAPERPVNVAEALLAVVLDGGGLQQVADRLADLLAATVLVTTPDGRVLVRAGSAGFLADADLSSEAAFSADTAFLADTGCFDNSGRLRTERLRPGVQADAAGAHVGVPILAGSLDHGRIVAFAHPGTLSPRAVGILEQGATVAALVITKQLAVAAVEDKYRGDFLRDLLAGHAGDNAAAVRHAATLGWDVDRPMIVLVAQLDPGTTEDGPGWPAPRPQQERFAAAWSSVVHARDPSAPVVGFSSEVVCVLGAGVGTDVERETGELAATVTGDGGGGRRAWSAGVGRVAAGLDELPAAYGQARKALSVGRLMHGGGGVAHFDRLGIFRLLSLVPDPRELQSFVTEVLGELAGDDAEAVDLRRTLEVLLETNLNVAETARLLHFHYNTLRYRMGKLERLLGPFPDDPRLRMNILLALQVRKLRGL